MSRHPLNSRRAPASTGPPNPRVPHTIEFAAKAVGLRFSGYASPTDASATAMTSPPPIPWSDLAAIRSVIDGATAARALVKRNHNPVI